MLPKDLEDGLASNPHRQALVGHSFFETLKREHLDRAGVAAVLGQWWHPLHYFPTFLARSIAVAPSIEMQTSLAEILHEEVGCGDSSMAHERVYVSTMTEVGFTEEEVSGSGALEETQSLVDNYESASRHHLDAIGAVYATEVADLKMVAGIGVGVRRLTGAKELPWVDIHVRQEPGHVQRATDAVAPVLDAAQRARVERAAETMWDRWVSFFTRLERTLEGTAASPARTTENAGSAPSSMVAPSGR